MLKQEQETISETPASQVRVTPEEMAKAMAAIEARKQQEAHQQATTLTLGEAVQDLALDATPEELFAEVKRQRSEKANARATAEQQERDKADAFQEAEERRQAALRMAQPAPRVSQQSTGWRGGWNGSINRPKRNRWIGIAVAFVVLPNLFGGLISGASHIFSSGASHVFSHATPVTTQSLATLPEGVSATCDTATLLAIKQGKPASAINVTQGIEVQAGSNANRWEIMKHNGHVYVHAYSKPLSEEALKAGPSIDLYNGDNVGELDGNSAQGQWVRLDTLGWNGMTASDHDWQRITASSVPTDEFSAIDTDL